MFFCAPESNPGDYILHLVILSLQHPPFWKFCGLSLPFMILAFLKNTKNAFYRHFPRLLPYNILAKWEFSKFFFYVISFLLTFFSEVMSYIYSTGTLKQPASYFGFLQQLMGFFQTLHIAKVVLSDVKFYRYWQLRSMHVPPPQYHMELFHYPENLQQLSCFPSLSFSFSRIPYK